MERLGPDIRVSYNAIALPNLGDQLWYIANHVDEKERMYGTILRSTATQTWVIRLDYDDSLVTRNEVASASERIGAARNL